jgi:hypothetical protein
MRNIKCRRPSFQRFGNLTIDTGDVIAVVCNEIEPSEVHLEGGHIVMVDVKSAQELARRIETEANGS